MALVSVSLSLIPPFFSLYGEISGGVASVAALEVCVEGMQTGGQGVVCQLQRMFAELVRLYAD